MRETPACLLSPEGWSPEGEKGLGSPTSPAMEACPWLEVQSDG